MKTNLWKLSCMALAMAAIVTGCNQNNELGTPAPSSEEDVLNVVATANDFVSSDATSRIIETNYTTTFEAGDNIGVFVVRDEEALVSNMKMTLGADGTTWAGENGAKLYYYKDADYIAYSPYTEGLSVTSEAEIISHFTTKLEGTTGQSTLADYQAADLMTAFVAAGSVTRGENITFKFAHQMSMIEIKVPIRAYKTNGETPYEYSAPLGLKVTMAEESAAGKEFSLCTFGKETITENESEVTKGIYRCIVAPSEAALTVEGQFQDGSAPVYFPATGGEDLSVTPEAGTYKGFDVNYTYDNYTTATRELKVGDYYYADGSIWPKELEDVPETGCIGKIFSLSTTAEDKAHGWKNGYVIALNNVVGTMASAVLGKWSSNTSEVAGGDDNVVTATSMTDDNKQAVFAAKNGYDMTLTLVEKGVTAAILARDYDCAYPEGTSGWFLPAPGQVAEFLNNLSPDVQKESTDWDFDTSNGFTDSREQELKTEMLQAVQAAFSIGDFFKGIVFDQGGTTDRWWTTLEVDAANAWAVEMKANGLLKFLSRGKNGNNASVRPILAF